LFSILHDLIACGEKFSKILNHHLSKWHQSQAEVVSNLTLEFIEL
jgi:hypothetical protein